MSLRANIQELTETHLKMGPTGKPVQAPSLLSELRAAVKPGNDGGGGGASSSAPIPINPDAVDLLSSITHEANVDYFEIHGVRYRGPLEGLLQTHDRLNDEWGAYIEGVTLGWIDRINGLLRPTKPRRKLGVECPSCGQRFHGEGREVCLTADCWGPNEEMLHPAAWHVRCEGCGAVWVGDDLKWLIAALNTPSQEVSNVG